MTIDEHLDEFEGFSILEFDDEAGSAGDGSQAVRLGLDWDAHDEGKKFVDMLAAFLAASGASHCPALVIGDWGGSGEGNDSAPAVEALVSARDKLPGLRHLFLGEMTVEESEISWINQSDVSPLFEAFPQLETLYLRGGSGLRLGRPRHANLRKLVIETGGLDGEVVREVASADFPNLTHLELWLGDDGYGNTVTEEDVRGLLASSACQNLTYLGLRDDCHADATAKLLAEIGIPPSVKTLDLSLGTLGDEGAQALAECSWLSQLKLLDLHHHYVSPELIKQLKANAAEVNDDDVRKPDEWGGELHRYVAVGE